MTASVAAAAVPLSRACCCCTLAPAKQKLLVCCVDGGVERGNERAVCTIGGSCKWLLQLQLARALLLLT